MGLFRSIKRAFGFSDNGDEPNDELDGINGERAARRPYVNPFKNDDKPEQETGSFEGAPGETTSDEVTEQLLGEVIAIVNHNLPPFVVDNLDGRVVAELVGAHHLDIHLDGAAGDPLVASLVLVEGFRAFLDKVVQGPPPVVVLEAAVDGLVADQGVLGDGHCRCFSTKVDNSFLLRKKIA